MHMRRMPYGRMCVCYDAYMAAPPHLHMRSAHPHTCTRTQCLDTQRATRVMTVYIYTAMPCALVVFQEENQKNTPSGSEGEEQAIRTSQSTAPQVSPIS